jgi:hypothetical protein
VVTVPQDNKDHNKVVVATVVAAVEVVALVAKIKAATEAAVATVNRKAAAMVNSSNMHHKVVATVNSRSKEVVTEVMVVSKEVNNNGKK